MSVLKWVCQLNRRQIIALRKIKKKKLMGINLALGAFEEKDREGTMFREMLNILLLESFSDMLRSLRPLGYAEYITRVRHSHPRSLHIKNMRLLPSQARSLPRSEAHQNSGGTTRYVLPLRVYTSTLYL